MKIVPGLPGILLSGYVKNKTLPQITWHLSVMAENTNIGTFLIPQFHSGFILMPTFFYVYVLDIVCFSKTKLWDNASDIITGNLSNYLKCKSSIVQESNESKKSSPHRDMAQLYDISVCYHITELYLWRKCSHDLVFICCLKLKWRYVQEKREQRKDSSQWREGLKNQVFVIRTGL